jgi:hypothetical protein
VVAVVAAAGFGADAGAGVAGFFLTTTRPGRVFLCFLGAGLRVGTAVEAGAEAVPDDSEVVDGGSTSEAGGGATAFEVTALPVCVQGQRVCCSGCMITREAHFLNEASSFLISA